MWVFILPTQITDPPYLLMPAGISLLLHGHDISTCGCSLLITTTLLEFLKSEVYYEQVKIPSFYTLTSLPSIVFRGEKKNLQQLRCQETEATWFRIVHGFLCSLVACRPIKTDGKTMGNTRLVLSFLCKSFWATCYSFLIPTLLFPLQYELSFHFPKISICQGTYHKASPE